MIGDEVMAAALIARILHHCHIASIRGKSCGVRQHAELQQTLHEGLKGQQLVHARRQRKGRAD